MIPLTAISDYYHHFMTMSHHLTEEYWELLGPNGPFLCELFHNQSQQLAQLQMANNALEDHAIDAQTEVSDAVAILVNMPNWSHSPRGTRAAKPECFDGIRDKAEQFV